MDHCIYGSIVASIAIYTIICLHCYTTSLLEYIPVISYSSVYVLYYYGSIQSIKILMNTGR